MNKKDVDKVIKIIKDHVKFGCDKMDNVVCDRLIFRIQMLGEEDQ